MLTTAQYNRLAPMVDANQAFINAAPNPRDPATHPLPFPDIGNAATGQVEQYRIWHELPEVFGAYLSGDGRNVTVWTGEPLGVNPAQFHSTWRNNFGAHCEAGRVRMNGTWYTWHGPGAGMYCTCRKMKRQPA